MAKIDVWVTETLDHSVTLEIGTDITEEEYEWLKLKASNYKGLGEEDQEKIAELLERVEDDTNPFERKYTDVGITEP